MRFQDSEELYLIPPALFYTEAYEVDYYYTWVGGAIGKIYYPGTLIEPPEESEPPEFTGETTLYTAWKEGTRGNLVLTNVVCRVDISDLLLSADVAYGKNQPFPYGEVEISKQTFNSDDYWASRNEMSVYLGREPTRYFKTPLDSRLN